MSKYIKVFLFKLKTELYFKFDFVASLFSFFIHVIVLYFLWDFILGNKISNGYSKEQIVWYVIIGELIIFSVTGMYKDVSDMIKNGTVSNMLIKPINFIWYIVAQEMTALVRFFFNFICAFILGILIAGKIKFNLPHLFCFIFSIILSLCLLISLNVMAGMFAFLTEENKSFYQIVSKFVLLVLFTPLEFFSEKFQILLRLLPTTYVVYPSAKILISFELKNSILLIISQVISIVTICFLFILIFRKGVKDINVNGG